MALHNVLGKIGEEQTEKYLKKLGYKILERNFRCKLGEIDIIALWKGMVVFVEVKTRTSNLWGEPVESIGSKKLQSIINTAQFYLCSHKNLPEKVRVDALEVYFKNDMFQFNHIKNITL